MEKRCPTCNRKYVDEDLNYCLADGSFLLLTNELTPPEPTGRISNASTEALHSAQTLVDTSQNPQPRTTIASPLPVSPPVPQQKSRLGWLFLALGAFLVVGLLGFFTVVLVVMRVVSGTDDETRNTYSGSSNARRSAARPTPRPTETSRSSSSASSLNLEGTGWAGTDSDGIKYEFFYLSDGRLRYTFNGTPYGGDSFKWSQSGDAVTMDMNQGYALYQGVLRGDRIDFRASNKVGKIWTITVSKIR